MVLSSTCRCKALDYQAHTHQLDFLEKQRNISLTNQSTSKGPEILVLESLMRRIHGPVLFRRYLEVILEKEVKI